MSITSELTETTLLSHIRYPNVFADTDSDLYFNRELSLLQFHQRVLAQATDPRHPLLERLFFLIIFSSNLDEFFEIRVAGLMQNLQMGDVVSSIDGIPPSEVLLQISKIAHEAVDEQYRILNESILPDLAKQDIRYLRRDELTPVQAKWVKEYFDSQVAPVLTPISIDLAHPFPRLVNKSLNFMVTLDGKDAFGREIDLAVVPAPRSLPRVIRLPDELTEGKEHHIMLTAVIHEHIGDLFPNIKITGCHQFRLTRNADLDLAEDVDDYAKALEGELDNRRFGAKVRLEVTENCPQVIADFLLNEFDLTEEQLYRVNGPVNLTRLLFDFKIPKLRYQAFNHEIPKAFRREMWEKNENVFHAIRKQDVLVHHPFHAFAPIVNLIRQAASDPNVLAIKQTLYRSGANSEIVQALAEAARNGKEVTAVIELRARFDEKSNIEVANLLQQAGAVVVYGVVGYKTHAKLMLIIRREESKLHRYAHLGTGNYHAGNAKAYTDYGLFTANEAITEDVHKIFNILTGMGKPAKLQRLLYAPFSLHDTLLQLIDNEIAQAKAGKQGRIVIKVNALTEKQIIDKLYEASQAGVKVDLIIRSICCLRPQLLGVSDNICVRSVIGRFLEHTRVYYFANGSLDDGKQKAKLYCASADLMERNLFNRVEVAFPIDDPVVFKRIHEDLQNYLKDNASAWQLSADGTWQVVNMGENEATFSAQDFLLQKIVFNKKTVAN
ncbi:polyphosphate kinase [Moraxella macacae 0408225]|uniref:Polyphosphate kinase n=1 Tax=Moraxella macacae 0408225 TaxID=1230338 RepID=L2F7F7_9GAMM|nr:polyphosphate kinase 1 [Moraxella macacae]ELA08696.1 polyphosphate kinase [Moraxella macacae 0408225]